MRAKLKFNIQLIALALVLVSFTSKADYKIDTNKVNMSSRIETFTFSVNGTTSKGKIYLPAAYDTNKNLPTIYLIDLHKHNDKKTNVLSEVKKMNIT